MNNETHSPQRETVEDLMAITPGFEARLYRGALRTALKHDEEGA